MRKCTLISIMIFFMGLLVEGQNPQWELAGDKITTSWAEEIEPDNVLPEYPRPQMVRENWQNLNGLWDYSIRPKSETVPSTFEGKILVPFAVESALSGVGRRVGKDSLLWYKTTFQLTNRDKDDRVLLHFGAVDWETTVMVNGQEAGTHQGGYDPFILDITELVTGSANNDQELVVKVWDPTSDGPQPRGKQINDPHGIWYTPVTGIWQTVWLEYVPETYIASLKITPDVDQSLVKVWSTVENVQTDDILQVTVSDGGTVVSEIKTSAHSPAFVPIDQVKLWSPDDPFLYDLTVSVWRNDEKIDQVESYFGMRKISMETDANGIQRMLLNNEYLFQFGPLDQGWWPDGLYTAPTDEALRFDIEKTKEMGFNMIRKHVKTEPARWYYHADQLGMLVWQDMPSGDLGNRWNPDPGRYGTGTEQDRTEESKSYFNNEWKEIMDDLHNHPSIVVWVPFNEAWGQFDTEKVVDWTVAHDPSRLVNGASGGNYTKSGHIIDIHNYPDPQMPKAELFGKDQILVLGEYGGLGLPLEGHTWQEKDNWGYRSFENKTDLKQRYSEYIDRVAGLIEKGLSAAIYTQTTDVEIEINGLMTYDRKVVKMPESELHQMHQKLYDVEVEMGDD